MRKFTIAITGLVLLSFLLSIYFYPQVPEQMATHWNSQGEVDGYMSKFWGLFFMPLVITSLAVMFLIIPRIDPKKENIEKFRKYYDGFIVILILFMIAVHLQILLWNAGVQISPNAILPVGIGLLFYYIGILTENAERNWFIGIRTPWTLSSDRVWKRTNRLGGKLFKIAGIVAVFGAFFSRNLQSTLFSYQQSL
ncbi:SdpI family protein [Methanosarcina horonobensis]|uniref:SdpI family protein n=1 Tax=Methanosarcina horonobensis TaxID=418008 RepID=UPI000ADA499E|nr:SdpI family protein [Methanosarcina horonobensis]